jgi:hypothetical protein
MATFEAKGGDLFVRMSGLEKLEACHGTVSVPLTAVRQVRTVEDPWAELRGIRAPGTGLPGVIAVGTRRGGFGKDFAVVHGKGPAVVVELEGAPYQRLIVTVDDPGTVAGSIRRALPTR